MYITIWHSVLTFAPQAYEKAVIQALYAHVRAGQLEEAVELCRKANQPWRAASIRGALLFQWRAIGTRLSNYISLVRELTVFW